VTLYALALTVRYRFDRPLASPAREVLRLVPADLPGVQRVLSSDLMITPKPVERRAFTDFFGSQATEVVMPAGTSEMVFALKARVDRQGPGAGLDLSTPRAGLAGEVSAQLGLGPDSPHHFLAPSPRIPQVPAILAFAQRAAHGAGTAQGVVRAVGGALHQTMTFDPRATHVDTPIATAFAGRRGVCQDLSQILIAGLRGLGIPAAYVSGFLRTTPPPGARRLQGADAMHAWVRAWTGARGGWVDYDPTNDCWAGAGHIVIGHGRDYADAAPVTGALRLDGAQSGGHTVDLEALEG